MPEKFSSKLPEEPDKSQSFKYGNKKGSSYKQTGGENTKGQVQKEDQSKIQQILEEIRGTKDGLKIEKEKAISFAKKYLEQYGRKNFPTELERIANLGKFLDQEKIEELIQKATKPTIKEKISSLFGKKTKAESIKEILIQERRMIETGEMPEVPCIIAEKKIERMHAGKGSYDYFFDQFGNKYFAGPDTTKSAEEYSNFLAKYFNVNKFVSVKIPGVLGNKDFGTRFLARFLAESSETLEREKIVAKDCDKIDPMPVTDPERSFVSSCVINLITGAQDRLVTKKRNEKNQSIRKDGVYYLYDMDSPIFDDQNTLNLKKQMEELREYFLNLEEEKGRELLEYLAKTAYFITALPKAEGLSERKAISEVCSAFSVRFHKMIEKYPLEEKQQAYLLEQMKKIEAEIAS